MNGSTANGRSIRSRAGCQQCRSRRRKCDERRPSCNACLKRNLPCNWHREQKVARKHSYSRQFNQNKDFSVPSEMAAFTTVMVTPTQPTVQTLISHFSQASPLWLTVRGNDRTGCLQIIMPSIQRSQLVLDCVLAVAAGDLSKYQPRSADMANLCHGFYGQAVAGVRSALDVELADSASALSSPHADDTLFAVLLLCIHEVVNFTQSDRILPHINAAALMCYNRSFSTATDSPLRRLLFEVFCYIFTLAAFSHGQNLQLSLASRVFSSSLIMGIQDHGLLIGRSIKLFYFILEISILTCHSSFTGELDAITVSDLQDIEAQLSNWNTAERMMHGDELRPADEIVTSELYRLACIIHLKMTLNPGFTIQSPQVREFVSQFVTSLEKLPPCSPANNILCWPLVVAGMAATAGSHRRIIAGRLQKNYETWRSDILSESLALLHKKWREDRNWERPRMDEPNTDSSTPTAYNRPFQCPIILA